ncbi:MAG: sugar phosphate isomerase/epimerase family protein [Bacteroidota bacterium]
MKNPIAMNLLVYGPEMDQNVLAELPFIAETGYQGIEIPIFNTDLAHWGPWKQEADRLGLQLFACGIAGPAENLISPDPAIRHAGLNYIKSTIDIAAFLGSPYISGPIHSALGVFSGKPATEQEMNWAVEGIREAANYAAEKNIIICLEYLNRFESYLVSCADELCALVKKINHPQVKIMFDTFHANIEEKNTTDALKRIADHTPHVQISESTRGILGEGQVDISNILLTLAELNYQGWIVVESFGIKLPAAHIWRKMFENERELIEKSYQHLNSLG